MQWWSQPAFALGCGVRAVLDEEPCRVWTGGPFEAAQSSGVRPSSLWAAASAPVLDEALCDFYMPLLGCKMQRR